MRHLRLLFVSFLSTLVITGCHHRRAQVVPPPQAQAPIVSTLPPVPPLAFPDVQLGKPKPAAPVVQAAAPTPTPVKHTARVHHHHTTHKADTENAENEPREATPHEATGASVLGQLSADDATVNPHQNVQTEQLIQQTENRLKKLSRGQRIRHKDSIVQVESFLAQAKQAWAMNDVVGATTLVNKAKILLDELLK